MIVIGYSSLCMPVVVLGWRNYRVLAFEGLAVSWAISYLETNIHDMSFKIIQKILASKSLKDKSLLKEFLRKLINYLIMIWCYT